MYCCRCGRSRWRTSQCSWPGRPPASRGASTTHDDVLRPGGLDSAPSARRRGTTRRRARLPGACARVIAATRRISRCYLGDGLLVYFGYPQAHEDDAQRAVRAGWGSRGGRTIEQPSRRRARGVTGRRESAATPGRGDRGGGGASQGEELALGETPNSPPACKPWPPDTLVIGGLAHQLLGGACACASSGHPASQGRRDADRGFRRARRERRAPRSNPSEHVTALVGREHELGAA